MADLETAYRMHAPALRGYLRRRLPRPQDAEDLCQESFARVIESGRLRDPGRLRAYLMQTAHNLLVNQLRRPRLVRSFSELGPDLDPELCAGASGDRSDAQVELRELEEHFERRLASLSPKQAEIFRRAVLAHEPYHRIANDLGLSVGAIKLSVFRTRQFLSEGLADRR